MRYVSMMAVLCIVFTFLAFGTQPAKAANEFSAMGFSLADTPEQVVDKALAKGGLRIWVSFPIQRQSKDIGLGPNVRIFPRFGWESKLLEKFLAYHKPYDDKKEGLYSFGRTIYGDISTTGWQLVSISPKNNSGVNIDFYYYTLPGGTPKAVMMKVGGTILNDVSDTFTKRYGKPQEKINANTIQNYSADWFMVWMSETECAMVKTNDLIIPGVGRNSLVIISKAAYEEIFGKYLAGVKAEQDAKNKAAAEQQKAKEKALKDSL